MGDPRDEVPSMEKYGASKTKSNGIAPPEIMYENAYDQIELNDLKKISQHGESSEPGTSEQTSEMTEEEETLDRDPNHPIVRMQDSTKNFFVKYGTYIGKITLLLMFVGYTIYFIYAVSYSYKDARGLIVVTSCVVLVLIYNWFRDRFGDQIWDNCMQPMDTWWDANFHIIKWFLYPGLVIALILYLCLDILEEPRQLQSISGLILFVTFVYVTSIYPDKVKWRPVVWGFALQFIFAVLVLRWPPGYDFIKWMADTITRFVNYAYDGAAVVFGDPWMIFHAFAFMGMPLLIYIGMVMSILYYYGVTQICAVKLGWIFQVTMGTTAIETLSVSANIFLNGMDTMLMLRCYLTRLTKSEFHCLLTGGHATVAGFAFALFVLFGAPPQHLLSAAVMSAPACMAICKLNHPETEESITHNIEDIMLSRGDEVNVFEAGANGAAVAGKTVVAVVVNYIAFLALLSWVDAVLWYFGSRVGYDDLSFETICSWLFWPFALLMGVELEYCLEVGKLIGLKVICSEILAFQKLGESIRNEALDDRSEAIATYAICGFSSLSTLAIAVGVWQAICPSKVSEMTGQMGRVILNANLSCFMTACIAGLMYTPEEDTSTPNPLGELVSGIFDLIPGYKDLMNLLE